MGKHFLVLGVIILTSVTIKAGTLYREIRDRSYLSQASRIIEHNTLLIRDLCNKQYTAFIPSDDAIAQYKSNTGTDINVNMLKYHLVNIPYRIQNLPPEINSDIFGNPKLYVTKLPSGQPTISGLGDLDYYINNAKVTKANINCTTDAGFPQVLNVVDQVLIATIPKFGEFTHGQFDNPDARTLLANHELYGLEEPLSVSEFKDQVQQLNIMDVFELPGSNTFFIPINHGAINMIDKEVVYSQILPTEALFTRTAQDPNKHYSSYSFTDNMKALISIETVRNTYDEIESYYVKSKIFHADKSHKTGTVLARIVHGNIPVKNGVVHLIDRPLMFVSSSIVSYLQEDDDQLKLFYELLRTHYNELSEQLHQEGAELTLFAPSNQAFNFVNEDIYRSIVSHKNILGELFKLHLVPGTLTTNMINSKSFRQLETLSNHRKLYIDINSSNSSNSFISLDGAGVNATIITPNIPTKNGVIHIIDRILGIPYESVHEALMTVPMLSSTAALSAQDDWYNYLYRRDKKFTFFAPSNNAWDFIKREMPSQHKRLFSGNFSYHAKIILEKHLKVGYDLSLNDLVNIINYGNTTKEKIKMLRGKIYFQAKVENISESSNKKEEYYVEWHGVQAKLIRPGVECTNGIIHIIDKVLMKATDATVSASSAYITNEYFIIGSAIFISTITVLNVY